MQSAETHRWLLKQWADHLRPALESMTGQAPRLALPESASPAPAAAMLWWQQGFTLAAEALVWIGATEAAWSALGGRVLKAAGIDEAEPGDLKGTYLEVLQQALSGLSRSLSVELQGGVTCTGGQESAPAATEPVFAVEIHYGPEPPAVVLVAFSEGLRQALSGAAAMAGAESGQPATGEVEARAVAAGLDSSKTLDLLLDVEMPVSVSFGRAHLPLKDVLKLTSGSIVELNRMVSEPVEIIVNNCVIARGEVVVVDGNYGVRIQQIISRQERLRTLH